MPPPSSNIWSEDVAHGTEFIGETTLMKPQISALPLPAHFLGFLPELEKKPEKEYLGFHFCDANGVNMKGNDIESKCVVNAKENSLTGLHILATAQKNLKEIFPEAALCIWLAFFAISYNTGETRVYIQHPPKKGKTFSKKCVLLGQEAVSKCASFLHLSKLLHQLGHLHSQAQDKKVMVSAERELPRSWISDALMPFSRLIAHTAKKWGNGLLRFPEADTHNFKDELKLLIICTAKMYVIIPQVNFTALYSRKIALGIPFPDGTVDELSSFHESQDNQLTVENYCTCCDPEEEEISMSQRQSETYIVPTGQDMNLAFVQLKVNMYAAQALFFFSLRAGAGRMMLELDIFDSSDIDESRIMKRVSTLSASTIKPRTLVDDETLPFYVVDMLLHGCMPIRSTNSLLVYKDSTATDIDGSQLRQNLEELKWINQNKCLRGSAYEEAAACSVTFDTLITRTRSACILTVCTLVNGFWSLDLPLTQAVDIIGTKSICIHKVTSNDSDSMNHDAMKRIAKKARTLEAKIASRLIPFIDKIAKSETHESAVEEKMPDELDDVESKLFQRRYTMSSVASLSLAILRVHTGTVIDPAVLQRTFSGHQKSSFETDTKGGSDDGNDTKVSSLSKDDDYDDKVFVLSEDGKNDDSHNAKEIFKMRKASKKDGVKFAKFHEHIITESQMIFKKAIEDLTKGWANPFSQHHSFMEWAPINNHPIFDILDDIENNEILTTEKEEALENVYALEDPQNPGISTLKIRNQDGDTPLLYAARKGQHKIVEFLHMKADRDDINSKDIRSGSTALILAAKLGNEELLKVLLSELHQDMNKFHTPLGTSKSINVSKKKIKKNRQEKGSASRWEKRLRGIEVKDYEKPIPKMNETDNAGMSAVQWASHYAVRKGGAKWDNCLDYLADAGAMHSITESHAAGKDFDDAILNISQLVSSLSALSAVWLNYLSRGWGEVAYFGPTVDKQLQKMTEMFQSMINENQINGNFPMSFVSAVTMLLSFHEKAGSSIQREAARLLGVLALVPQLSGKMDKAFRIKVWLQFYRTTDRVIDACNPGMPPKIFPTPHSTHCVCKRCEMEDMQQQPVGRGHTFPISMIKICDTNGRMLLPHNESGIGPMQGPFQLGGSMMNENQNATLKPLSANSTVSDLYERAQLVYRYHRDALRRHAGIHANSRLKAPFEPVNLTLYNSGGHPLPKNSKQSLKSAKIRKRSTLFFTVSDYEIAACQHGHSDVRRRYDAQRISIARLNKAKQRSVAIDVERNALQAPLTRREVKRKARAASTSFSHISPGKGSKKYKALIQDSKESTSKALKQRYGVLHPHHIEAVAHGRAEHDHEDITSEDDSTDSDSSYSEGEYKDDGGDRNNIVAFGAFEDWERRSSSDDEEDDMVDIQFFRGQTNTSLSLSDMNNTKNYSLESLMMSKESLLKYNLPDPGVMLPFRGNSFIAFMSKQLLPSESWTITTWFRVPSNPFFPQTQPDLPKKIPSWLAERPTLDEANKGVTRVRLIQGTNYPDPEVVTTIKTMTLLCGANGSRILCMRYNLCTKIAWKAVCHTNSVDPEWVCVPYISDSEVENAEEVRCLQFGVSGKDGTIVWFTHDGMESNEEEEKRGGIREIRLKMDRWYLLLLEYENCNVENKKNSIDQEAMKIRIYAKEEELTPLLVRTIHSSRLKNILIDRDPALDYARNGPNFCTGIGLLGLGNRFVKLETGSEWKVHNEPEPFVDMDDFRIIEGRPFLNVAPSLSTKTFQLPNETYNSPEFQEANLMRSYMIEEARVLPLLCNLLKSKEASHVAAATLSLLCSFSPRCIDTFIASGMLSQDQEDVEGDTIEMFLVRTNSGIVIKQSARARFLTATR
eukprot:g2028.t1